MRPLEERFWAKVDKSGDCWLWTASKNRHGYGQIRMQGRKTEQAHRLAWTFANGPIPTGLMIDHMCHTRGCVRSSHLRTVTHKQNSENRAGAPRHSVSGIRGVGWHKQANKWRVRVKQSGISHSGGLFDSLEDAEAAAIALRNSLFTHNDMDRERAA